jgi:hypothetical protein
MSDTSPLPPSKPDYVSRSPSLFSAPPPGTPNYESQNEPWWIAAIFFVVVALLIGAFVVRALL